MKKLIFAACAVSLFALAASAQLSLPRESQRQEIIQTVGDTKVSIVYHRPNTKGRKVWGELVPFGKAWRTGANENTTIEFSRDVTINGQPLPAGKYGFHAIPTETDWTLIFSKVNDAWGSFTYDPAKDALRVAVKPVRVSDARETLMYEFDDVTNNSARVVLSWEKMRVPFTVDIGNVQARTVAQIREAIANRKADDPRPLNQGASYVYTFRVKDSYGDALGWLDTSLSVRPAFGTMVTKARLLAEMGRTAEAIAEGEKAIAFGKSQSPPSPTEDIERFVAEWKAKK